VLLALILPNPKYSCLTVFVLAKVDLCIFYQIFFIFFRSPS